MIKPYKDSSVITGVINFAKIKIIYLNIVFS